jgi:hypothetical protein
MPSDKARSIYIFAILLSLMELHVYGDLHSDNAQGIAHSVIDITDGHAYWRAYQNRLIGPWIMKLLQALLHSEEAALYGFATLGIVGANITAAWLSVRYLRDQFQALIALAIFVFGYMMLFDYWTYPWDFVEVVTFLLFAHFAAEGKQPLYLLPIFLISVVNRESSVFIGAWFAIYAVGAKLTDRNSRLNIPYLVWSAILVAAAGVYTMASRQLLFISSPAWGSDAEHQGFGNHFVLLTNLKTGNFSVLVGFIILSICAIFTTRYATFAYARRSAVDISLSVLIVLVLTQMLLFALLEETRTFYTVLPLIFVASLRWWRDASANVRIPVAQHA